MRKLLAALFLGFGFAGLAVAQEAPAAPILVIEPAAGGPSLDAYAWQSDANGERFIADCTGSTCTAITSAADWTLEFAFKSVVGTTAEFRTIARPTAESPSTSMTMFIELDGNGTDCVVIGSPSGGGDLCASSFGGSNCIDSGNPWACCTAPSTGTCSWDDDVLSNTSDWFHIAIGFDQSEEDCFLWLDGILIASDTTCNPSGSAGGRYFMLAGGSAGTDEIDAKIADIRVWNTLRSTANIAAHDRCQLDCADGGSCPSGLVEYWSGHGDSTSGTTITSDGSGGTSGTLSSSALWVTGDPPFGGWTNDGSNDCQ